MNIFKVFAAKTEHNGYQASFDHFAANVFYALRVSGFEVEEKLGLITIRHEEIIISENLSLQDTLAALVRDGVFQRMRENIRE